MDASDQPSRKPFGHMNSSIGPLSLFACPATEETALYNELGMRVMLCDPERFVRRLARHICFPSDQLPRRGTRPAAPVLTVSDAEDLSDIDLEVFSALYLQNHPWLYKKFETARSVDKNGRPRIASKLGEVIFPKEEHESFVRYLHRLAGLKQERELEQARKQAEKERQNAADLARSSGLVKEIKKAAGELCRPLPGALVWIGFLLTLISFSSLAVSLHVLALARRQPSAAPRPADTDITLNISFELSRIAELLNSLHQAQATAGVDSAGLDLPPQEEVPEPAGTADPSVPANGPEPAEQAPAAPPPEETGQAFKYLRYDCPLPSRQEPRDEA